MGSTSTTSTSTRWTRITCTHRAERCCSPPFGYLPVDASRYWFITFNTVAILLAAYFLLRLFKFSLASVAAPALLLAMFCTESVTSTLVFTNINGCILLGEVLFLRWLLSGKVGHEWLAGAAIGLTLVVKPSLAPLLLLPVLNRQWRALVPAFGGAAAVQRRRVATGQRPDGIRAQHRAVHPLGARLLQQLDPGQRDLLRPAVVADPAAAGDLPGPCGRSLWLLYRYYRERDQLFWMVTSSGVLLIATFLVTSLGQGYYSMMLFPFLMSVVLPNSVIRNWVAWLAIYGFMTMDRWLLIHWLTTGRFLEYMKITYGWSLMLVVVFCVLYFRYLDAKADGRLDDGIDPPWMTTDRDRASVER